MNDPDVAEQRSAGSGAVLRWSLAALATLLLSAFVLSVTIAGVFRDAAPDTAIRFAPFDGRARASAASAVIATRRDRSSALSALEQARSAFHLDATAISSYTAAAGAMAVLGQGAPAVRLFQYSERLSRRHAPTQIAMIELSVQRNDVDGALRHYDTILRSSDRTKPLLFPVLTSAAAYLPIADRLNHTLRQKPNWRGQFLSYLLGASESPEALYVVHRNVLDPSNDADRELGLQLLRRLSDAGRFDLVWRAYGELSRTRNAEAALLRDGTFEGRGGWPPVDWQFADEPGLAAERLPRESGDGFALHLPTAAGAEGVAARQLLRLRPGAYELRALVGEVPADELRRPFIRIGCAEARRNWSTQLDLPATPSGEATLRHRVVVPSGCTYHWLSIHVRGGLEDALEEAPWLSSLSLRRF